MRLRSSVATILLLTAGAAGATSTEPESPEPFAEAIVELRINDQPASTTLVVRRDTDGTLLLRATDLAGLRLRTPARGAVQINGERYYRLGRELGAVVVFDEGTQSGQVTLPPKAFLPTRVDKAGEGAARAERTTLGAFVNYDVSMEQDDRRRQGGGFFELGLFGGPGVVTGTMVARVEQGQPTVARLDTTWTRDFPDRLATLRVGDSISTPGAWGRAVRFGGIQYGTNFSTQPSLVTTPLLAAHGEATVPSTVDVFVNQRQVASEQVPPGPFSIDRLPVLTGAGQLQVIVTDALGRQQVITQPYYSGTALLRPGLSEYAVELGSLREDYGSHSFGYGSLMGSATYRRGLRDTLTAGARVEAQAEGAVAAGADLALQAGRLGIVTAHAAASAGDGRAGYLAALGVEHNGQSFSAYGQVQYTSPTFLQVGMADVEHSPRGRAFAGLGRDFERYGSLQLAYGMQSYHDSAAVETLGVSYSLALGSLGYLGLFATHAGGTQNDTSFLLSWTLPLGDRRTWSTSLQQSSAPAALGGGLSAYTTLQRDLPSDAGFGYRVALSTTDDQDASLAYQGRAGTATIDYARRDGTAGVRAGATGAVALTSAGVMPARRLDQSFAVVQVADYEGLTVYLDNQPVGRTDAHGRVLVSPLRPYERNEIGLNPLEVPMEAAIDRPAIDVTPAYRSGAVVRFPVTRAEAATMRIVQPDGTPVPAGAQATVGDAGVFPVALDGMLYVEGLREPTRVRVVWHGGECTVPVRRPPGTDPVPDLGTLRCR